ncbi:predicted protein [Histoplasma capsulatum G186AR]|uniref:Uncharacterized protein n=1 Tax=Ajellomyces capsulatus (strain G186AR / H82 / ATCC MYA-2454 / RMSCC 2432) TaxID=447093 RepID=C0NF71_AJECG|nr:uncharacterized protein HCBG_01537 [Histoplasma capsulatum G186AR]EEH09892.1 predicted protein [Histoplasma capsulatum G186AR]
MSDQKRTGHCCEQKSKLIHPNPSIDKKKPYLLLAIGGALAAGMEELIVRSCDKFRTKQEEGRRKGGLATPVYTTSVNVPTDTWSQDCPSLKHRRQFDPKPVSRSLQRSGIPKGSDLLLNRGGCESEQLGERREGEEVRLRSWLVQRQSDSAAAPGWESGRIWAAAYGTDTQITQYPTKRYCVITVSYTPLPTPRH